VPPLAPAPLAQAFKPTSLAAFDPEVAATHSWQQPANSAGTAGADDPAAAGAAGAVVGVTVVVPVGVTGVGPQATAANKRGACQANVNHGFTSRRNFTTGFIGSSTASLFLSCERRSRGALVSDGWSHRARDLRAGAVRVPGTGEWRSATRIV
jgi:hypothetical protein